MSDGPTVATEHDVENCYRVFLGRPPENPEVVSQIVARKAFVWDVIREFVHSEEAATRRSSEVSDRIMIGSESERAIARLLPAIGSHLAKTRYSNVVEADGTPAQLDELFAQVRQVWAKYGEEEPFWSVLVGPEFRRAAMNQASEETFYQTGRVDCDLFAEACARNSMRRPTTGTVVDFGCGVGRLGQHLSLDFSDYIGVDISRPHIDLAARRMRQLRRENCAFRLLPDFLASDVRFDAFMSLIVLQHNPPPVMKFLLQTLLDRLRPGGLAYFQIPCFLFDYEFRLDEYLSIPASGRSMEMHALPQRLVFDIIAASSCRLVEMTMDGWIGAIGLSYTFLVAKP